jgi:hypothetical protein
MYDQALYGKLLPSAAELESENETLKAEIDELQKKLEDLETGLVIERYNGGVVLGGKFYITPRGIHMEETVTEDEYWLLWEIIKAFDDAIQWMIGDAMVYGTLKFQKTYKDVESQVGRYTADYLKQIAHVARQVPPPIRSYKLGFALHRAVALDYLSEDQKRNYLELAERNKWSESRLKQEISGQLAPSKQPAWRKTLDRIETNYFTKGRWKKLQSDTRQEILHRLERLVSQLRSWDEDAE